MPPIDQIDLAERIVRLETKLDFLISQMNNLPPSPTCLEQHKKFDARLDSFEAWRNRTIGAVMVFNIAIVVFLDKIKNFFAN